MTTANHKQEILQSLNILNSAQSAKVLQFIRELVNNHKRELYKQQFKSQAMKEIDQALGKRQPFNGGF
jgi:hypothetical protein